jgi:hypothetical protein
MRIGRRGFLASLIAAPLLARILPTIRTDQVYTVNVDGDELWGVSIVGPLLKSNVYGLNPVLFTEEVALRYIAAHRRKYDLSRAYWEGTQWRY